MSESAAATEPKILFAEVNEFRYAEELLDLDPQDINAERVAKAATVLREALNPDQRLGDDPVAEAARPVMLVLRADGLVERMRPAEDGEIPDGWATAWKAPIVEAIRDPENPLPGVKWDDDTYDAYVDAETSEKGGPVRVRHGLDCEVIVATFKGDEPIGHLLWQDLTTNEVHVETTPGTTRIRVERDPDADEDDT